MRQILLAAGILGGGMLPALAQDLPPLPPVTAGETPAPTTFAETIVVSASLAPEERQDLPASVTVIDREEIAARQATSLADLLPAVPGLTLLQAGSPGQQTSLFVRGGESEQTLLLWNGIPLNDPYFGGANWQFVPADGVARIEVVRGPFSALYGGNALGGVVQVLTGAEDGGTLRLEAGEDGYARGGVTAGLTAGRARLDVAGHLRQGEGALVNDRYDSEGLLAHARFSVRPGVEVGLLARAGDAETGIPTNGFAPTPRAEIRWREREVALPVTAEMGRWKLEAQLSQVRFDSAFRDPDDPFGFTASDTESEALRGRAVATHRFGGGLWVALGSETERFEVTNTSSFGTNLDAADQRTWAVFSQTGWERGPFHLEAGLRRDDNDVYGGATSLRLGGVVELGAGTRLRASYGESFRAPSLGELFYPVSGNPELEPETGESYELGIERSAGPWRLALTGFENRQRNLIDLDFAVFRNVNVGRAESRGLEAEAGYRRGMVTTRLNGTWLDTEDLATGLPLLRRPERSANLFLGLAREGWTASVEGRWVGPRDDRDPARGFERRENPGSVRVDLAASRRVLSWLAPYARVENAADEEYADVLGYPAPGRTLIGGLAVDF